MKRLFSDKADPFWVKKGLRASRQSLAQRQRLRVVIWNLRRLLREAMGDGVSRDLLEALRWLAANGPAVEGAVVAWVSLIEVLVQHTEERYGSEPGRGALKASEVKAVFRYLLRQQRIDLPRLPSYLEPLVLDVAVGVGVDLVVSIVNDNGLWVADNRKPKRGPWTLRRILFLPIAALKWAARVSEPLWGWVPRLLVAVVLFCRRRAPLSPELLAALAALERQGHLASLQSLLTGLTRLLVWIGRHAPQVIAGFRLVVAAVQEAEGFLTATGAEKRAYARDLVWALLADLGLDLKGGLLYAALDVLIGAAIEVAVKLFHERGAFTHRRLAGAPAGGPSPG